MSCCYKVSFNGELLYVGSTGNFKKRVSNHKSGLENGKDRPFYNYLRENNIEFNELVFEEIETECETIEELRRTEGLLIRELNPVCNIRIEGRTDKEYHLDNREQILKQKKEYYEDNIEQIKEYRKGYYEKNKDIAKLNQKEYYDVNKEQILEKRKEYIGKNKELISEKSKEHYEKNKDEINRKRREDRKNNPEKYREQDRRKYLKKKQQNN